MALNIVVSTVVTVLGLTMGLGLLAYTLWTQNQRLQQQVRSNQYGYSNSYRAPPSRAVTPKRRKSRSPSRRNSTTDSCSICYEPLVHAVHTLHCKHQFHITCLGEWLKTGPGSNCPMCRAEVL